MRHGTNYYLNNMSFFKSYSRPKTFSYFVFLDNFSINKIYKSHYSQHYFKNDATKIQNTHNEHTNIHKHTHKNNYSNRNYTQTNTFKSALYQQNALKHFMTTQKALFNIVQEKIEKNFDLLRHSYKIEIFEAKKLRLYKNLTLEKKAKFEKSFSTHILHNLNKKAEAAIYSHNFGFNKTFFTKRNYYKSERTRTQSLFTSGKVTKLLEKLAYNKIKKLQKNTLQKYLEHKYFCFRFKNHKNYKNQLINFNKAKLYEETTHLNSRIKKTKNINLFEKQDIYKSKTQPSLEQGETSFKAQFLHKNQVHKEELDFQKIFEKMKQLIYDEILNFCDGLY